MQRSPKRTRTTLAAERDARLRRAATITRWTAGSAVILVGAFAGLFANARPGHHLRQATQAPSSSPAPSDTGAAPAAPSLPPEPAPGPPVVQSGGS